jgi:signal transduction histidine kinase
VKKLAHALGGTVSLQSELGQGSIFTVTLPLDTMKIEQGVNV